MFKYCKILCIFVIVMLKKILKMKNLVYIFTVLFFSVASAQDTKRDFVLDEETNIIEATYYHENGAISQKGTFNQEGNLDGEWSSFDKKGKKIASAMYKNGNKVGKWYFLANNTLKEINYNNNVIASVSELNNTAIIADRSN